MLPRPKEEQALLPPPKKPAPNSIEKIVRDESTNQIVGYYNPPSLSPEYPAPELVSISYTDQIPTVKGLPFWERLPDEPPSYYQAFAHFRDQPDNYPQTPVRLISRTASHLDIDPEVMESVAQTWLWDQRVQSYEDYADVLVQRARAKKIVVMESEHSRIADKFLEKAEEALDQQDLEKVSPFVIMEWAKAAVAMKRLSHRVSPEEADDGSNHLKDKNQNPGAIELSGENQKVQIVFNKDWQST